MVGGIVSKKKKKRVNLLNKLLRHKQLQKLQSQSQRLDNKLRPLQQHRVKMSGSKRNGRKIVVMIVAVRVN